jgi:hypothetical protein
VTLFDGEVFIVINNEFWKNQLGQIVIEITEFSVKKLCSLNHVYRTAGTFINVKYRIFDEIGRGWLVSTSKTIGLTAIHASQQSVVQVVTFMY